MFDAHAHWLPEEIIENSHFYSKAWGDIEKHLELMAGFKIDKTLIIYPTNDAHTRMGSHGDICRKYNDGIAEIARRYPDMITGAAILPVDSPVEMMTELKRATEGLGFNALSLGSSFDGIYLDDERFFPLYEIIAPRGIPVFIHPQTINPIGFERIKHPLLTPVIEYVFDTTICIGKIITSSILKRFPGLKLVFAHFGGVTPFIKERFDSVYKMLRGREIVEDLGALPTEYLKQLYVDTSGVTTKAALQCTIDMVGAEHVLWGSDYPGNPDIPASIRAIEEMDITGEEKSMILGGNVERMLKP